MLNFFKKSAVPLDLSWLGPDMHSHLLPGLDDGAPDVSTSLQLLRGLNELGFQKLYTTPHIFKELYPNSSDTIYPVLEKLQNAIKEEGLKVEIETAAEYMLDEHFSPSSNLLCLPKKHVLIEMSYIAEFPYLEKMVFDLKIKGYEVILAHPERYTFYHRNHEPLHRLKNMGTLFQLNLLSVTGYYGKSVLIEAEYLLKKGYYHFAGTDLHHEKHLAALKECTKNGQLYKKLGKYPFQNQIFE